MPTKPTDRELTCPRCIGTGLRTACNGSDLNIHLCPYCEGYGKVTITHEYDDEIGYLQEALKEAKAGAKRHLLCVDSLKKQIQNKKKERQRFLKKSKQ